MFSKSMLMAAVAGAVAAAAGPVSAADLDVYDDGYAYDDSAVVINVHSRGYRHCHWIDGDRVCHRRGVPYAGYYGYDDWDYPYYGDGYGWGPGIVLGFGGRGFGYGGHGFHGGGHHGGHGGHH